MELAALPKPGSMIFSHGLSMVEAALGRGEATR